MDNKAANTDETLADSGFFWRERDGVKVLVSRQLAEAGFVNGFSTRLGGVSPFPVGDLNLAGFSEDTEANITENRRRFLNVFDGEYQLASVWQMHGDVIKALAVVEDIGNSEDKADALVSDLTGVLAGVKTADCVPILIGDPATGAYSAIHAGWRGTAISIAAKAAAKMTELYGSEPANMIAAIGPAASCENYEVGTDVMVQFSNNFERSEQYFSPTREGHALVDLHRANRDQLVDAGLSNNNISTSPFCTMERPDLFFSYRLEKKRYGKTGRLMSVIGRGQ